MLLFKFLGVPKADVGAYGVAFRLIEAFLLLATPVSLMLFRHFRLSAISASSATFYQIFRVAVLASGIGLTICGIAFLSASWFFITVFGEDFALAGDLFVVLSLMLVFALANGVLGQGVFALGLDRQYLVTATLAAVFNVSANICFMPRFGVWAAAWLTVATELVLAMGLVVALTMAWKKKNYGETSLE
jgi:O-antigen/teichoic acid export membrane protein